MNKSYCLSQKIYQKIFQAIALLLSSIPELIKVVPQLTECRLFPFSSISLKTVEANYVVQATFLMYRR